MATINTGNLFDDAISNIIVILKANESSIGIHDFNRGDQDKNTEDTFINVKFINHEEERSSIGSVDVKVILNLIIRIELIIRRQDENSAENELTRLVSSVSKIMRGNVFVNNYIYDVANGGEGLSILGSSRAEQDPEDQLKSMSFIDLNIHIIKKDPITTIVV